jgi:hypothetical protein
MGNTPILDRQQPPPTVTSKGWLRRGLPLLVGAVIGVLVAFLDFDLDKLWAFYLALLDRRPASGLIAAERARTLDLLQRSAGAAT